MIYSKIIEKYCIHFNKILILLKKQNLIVKLKKYIIVTKELKFCKYIIKNSIIYPILTKIKII